VRAQLWHGSATTTGAPGARTNGPTSGQRCATTTARTAGRGTCRPAKAKICPSRSMPLCLGRRCAKPQENGHDQNRRSLASRPHPGAQR
jgi:hypothetical protein